jgi:hypothetical protein
MTLAHIAGLPLEEMLLPLAPAAGAAWLVLRSWVGRARR